MNTNYVNPLRLLILMTIVIAMTSCENKTNDEKENEEQNIDKIIALKSGIIEGEKLDKVYRYLGIPYAQSIAGKNRFAPPQAVKPWKDTLKVQAYADSSPQQLSDPTSGSPVTPAFNPPSYVKPGDNCLALNVWTPEHADGSLPVMVWLHGGGWTSGSGSCAIYDGENLANRGDVVIVTINHRLGASGLTDFSRVLGGDYADSSNLGIKDMIAALEWVKGNIKAFGGNPDLVTIFGESGGGWKVNTLLGTPSAKGLFHRAIVESGPLTRFMTPEQADEIANQFLNELGIDKEHPEALNELSNEAVLRAEAAVLSNTPMSFQAPGFPTGFWPTIDGDLIKEHVYDPTAASSSVDVPLLIGQTGTEFALFMLGDQAAYNLDQEGLQRRVAGMFGHKSASKILETYNKDFPDYDPSGLWFRIFSDYAMGTLSSEIMDVRSQAPNAAPVYAYRFNWQTPIANGKLYSPHTIEIPFVFDNATNEAGTIMTGGGAEVGKLAEIVSEAWVNFAKTGTPAAKRLPEWPEYTTETRSSMHLNTSSKVAPYMDEEMVELFHGLLWQRAGLTD